MKPITLTELNNFLIASMKPIIAAMLITYVLLVLRMIGLTTENTRLKAELDSTRAAVSRIRSLPEVVWSPDRDTRAPAVEQ